MARRRSLVYVLADDESVRAGFARLLRSANFSAETFSSPGEFTKKPKQKEEACVLVDIPLPGSTGFDLDDKLASWGVDLPAVVISASDDALARERARELGAVAFFRKPIDD